MATPTAFPSIMINESTIPKTLPMQHDTAKRRFEEESFLTPPLAETAKQTSAGRALDG
jgi:hypothetical protein